MFVCQIKTLFEHFGAPQSQFSSDGQSSFSDLLYRWQYSEVKSLNNANIFQCISFNVIKAL